MTVLQLIKKIKSGEQWLFTPKAFSDTKLIGEMIQLEQFIQSDPLSQCPQYLFLRSRQEGKEIPIEYYPGDREKLLYYYKKMDSDDKYKIVGREKYNQHCLFATLKLNGWYNESMNEFFSVTYKDGREYNPTTKIPNEVRQLLPFETFDYDIHAAYPSFLDFELGITRRRDVYELIDGPNRDEKKLTFNRTINTHKGITRKSIDELRSILSKAYPNQEHLVLTDECFNTQGLMFKRLVKYEQSYIERFTKENGIQNYIRVHDGVLIAVDLERPIVQFDNILFKYKELKLIHHEIPVWYYTNDKEKLAISSHKLSQFLEMYGFIRTPSLVDIIEAARIQNKIVTPFAPKTETTSYLLSTIPRLLESKLADLIAAKSNTNLMDAFKLMNPTVPEYYMDTKDTFAIPFKNGLLKYTKNKSWELIPYDKTPSSKFFAAHATTEYDFNIPFDQIKVRAEKSEAFQFCFNICNHDPIRFTNLIKILGYLCHTFKNPADNPCIIFSDEGATNDDRKGRRGKGLLTKIIQNLRPNIEISGKDYTEGNQFKFSRLDTSHRIMIIDEADYDFDYKSLYTEILNPIKVEKKNKGEFLIPFKLSPKIIITTNFIIKYSKDDTSTNERFCEFQVSDYYNGSDSTPLKDFGHLFFEDWSPEEWMNYFCLMAQCGELWIDSDRVIPRMTTDKINDNFRALFYNEEIIFDFEKTLEAIQKDCFIPNHLRSALTEFNATVFVKEYDLLRDRYKKPAIHIRNVAKLIHAYFDNYPEIGKQWEYSSANNVKKWTLLSASNYTQV